MRLVHASLFALLLILAACSGAESGEFDPGVAPLGPGTTTVTSIPLPDPTPVVDSLIGLTTTEVASGLDRPVFATAPWGDERLFVVEQSGRIRVVSGGRLLDEPFLDITDDVGSDDLEQGLLGLAFHPRFPADARFFVYYTDGEGDTRVVSYRVSADPDVADLQSGIEMLAHPQPASNHNGGMLGFGIDGYLYVSLGDGGGADDQFGNGQRTDTLLGTILRLDVDGGVPYAIPLDNPFAGGGGAPQVWAYGLRNPWRFDIDPVTGLMFVADVGQAEWEEVSVVDTSVAGANFGWSIVEGDECFAETPCDTTGLEPPVVIYDHSQGCSIIGGFVYRGALIPEIAGHYFYSDWCGGWIRSFRFEEGEVVDATDWTGDLGTFGRVLSFGRDGAGELYVLGGDGTVSKIVARR